MYRVRVLAEGVSMECARRRTTTGIPQMFKRPAGPAAPPARPAVSPPLSHVGSMPDRGVVAPGPPGGEWFAGFGGAPTRQGGSYIAPGQYLAEIVELARAVSGNHGTQGHQLFIARFRIVEVVASFPADPTPPTGWPQSNTLGEEVSAIYNTTKHGDTALANMKGLLLAIAKCDSPELTVGDVTPAEWQQAILDATEPPGTKYQGYVVRIIAGKKMTRARTNFTNVTFGPHSAPLAQE